MTCDDKTVYHNDYRTSPSTDELAVCSSPPRSPSLPRGWPAFGSIAGEKSEGGEEDKAREMGGRKRDREEEMESKETEGGKESREKGLSDSFSVDEGCVV